MPFSPEFDDVYANVKTSVESALPGEAIRCYRLDELKGAGQISDDLIKALRGAAFCVADISGHNPNVMWEVGYAMALKKPTIFIKQELANIPFDIKDMRTLAYVRQSITKTLNGPLCDAARATVASQRLVAHAQPEASTTDRHETISVTGSMDADPTTAARRTALLLTPYIGGGTTWLCGSNGVVDEAVLSILGEAGEAVRVYGYHALDFSSKAAELMRRHSIPFYDASIVPLPSGLEAPSYRDLLFLSKADFHILLWNGHSRGIDEIRRFYGDHKVNHILGFV
jgi:hypothetical protein